MFFFVKTNELTSLSATQNGVNKSGELSDFHMMFYINDENGKFSSFTATLATYKKIDWNMIYYSAAF